jgi:hypothetical protein
VVVHQPHQLLPARTQRHRLLISLGVDLNALQDYPHHASLGTLALLPEDTVLLIFRYLSGKSLGQCLCTSRSFNMLADQILYSNQRPFYAVLPLGLTALLTNKDLVNLAQASKTLCGETQEPRKQRKSIKENSYSPIGMFCFFKKLDKLNIIKIKPFFDLYIVVKGYYESQRSCGMWKKERFPIHTTNIVEKADNASEI